MGQGPRQLITFPIRKAVPRRHLVGSVGLVLRVATADVSYAGAMVFQYKQGIKIITAMIEKPLTAVCQRESFIGSFA